MATYSALIYVLPIMIAFGFFAFKHSPLAEARLKIFSESQFRNNMQTSTAYVKLNVICMIRIPLLTILEGDGIGKDLDHFIL